MGSRDSPMEIRVGGLLDGTATGELFTDDIRCPVRAVPADRVAAPVEAHRRVAQRRHLR